MKKLRLLLFKDCNRDCLGCCNKDWDLDSLEKETSYKGYNEIMLTGGEPMLRPEFVIKAIKKIRKKTNTKIYMYTAKVDDIHNVLEILELIDGITITLHTQEDIIDFKLLNFLLLKSVHDYESYSETSFRLNIFKGINTSGIDLSLWKIKSDIKWIKRCPLPLDEVFKRY